LQKSNRRNKNSLKTFLTNEDLRESSEEAPGEEIIFCAEYWKIERENGKETCRNYVWKSGVCCGKECDAAVLRGPLNDNTMSPLDEHIAADCIIAMVSMTVVIYFLLLAVTLLLINKVRKRRNETVTKQCSDGQKQQKQQQQQPDPQQKGPAASPSSTPDTCCDTTSSKPPRLDENVYQEID